jgi:HAD superfamily hydrolase (TIGR01509 family)
MGTLVHDPFYLEVPAHFGMSLSELVKVVHPTSWIEFEHGRIDESAYLATFFKDRRAVDGPALKACMSAAYRLLEGIEPLLEELARTGVSMHALSNYSLWYGLIEERLRLSRFVEWSFVSCDTGLRKPSAETYLHAAARLGLPPGECLFVDDRPPNCTAAERVGMPAIHFQGSTRLRAALVERGLLPGSSSGSSSSSSPSPRG